MTEDTELNQGNDDMVISVGDTLPSAKMIRIGKDGPEEVGLDTLTKGRKVAIFAVPGAFTPTCHSAHVPSFIRTKEQLNAKGVDDIICVSVNDPFVMKSWGEASGATDAGLHMLADAESTFTTAIGMNFDAPPAGLMARSKRYVMLVDAGVVKILNVEESPGVCEVSAGEALLDAL